MKISCSSQSLDRRFLASTMDLAGWVPCWVVRSPLAKELAAVFPRLQHLTAAATSLLGEAGRKP